MADGELEAEPRVEGDAAALPGDAEAGVDVDEEASSGPEHRLDADAAGDRVLLPVAALRRKPPTGERGLEGNGAEEGEAETPGALHVQVVAERVSLVAGEHGSCADLAAHHEALAEGLGEPRAGQDQQGQRGGRRWDDRGAARPTMGRKQSWRRAHSMGCDFR